MKPERRGEETGCAWGPELGVNIRGTGRAAECRIRGGLLVRPERKGEETGSSRGPERRGEEMAC